MCARVLGALRLHLGRELGLIDEEAWRFLWVTDFPLFEWDEEERRWTAVHHPFTAADALWALLDTDPGAARAVAYDIVGNGTSSAAGSFRIHEPELQRASSGCSVSRRRSSARSSAFCSMPWRWAHRRTGASPPASTAG